MVYQKEAEDTVAPGGKLIADPIERNKRINQAYARCCRHDMHEQIQANNDADRRVRK
ncbi:hypothetical protein XBJ2_1580001 [Xenorhabdus bovienii str. Jollieti]|uniref:Uncharacterized protein n=1 Tax=Xenorhabdus bovienii (strain SS-2004) TaxID=406818 RepID=D3V8L1_XENBS|nr:hypothetical protein [Xenorhabdus bovienii]CBJ82173.1 hypothetical protein XBJ1_3049 [Xenorhabdus bovienii SS-2004]CDH27995.1 hypothetical protein XBJ2_1580001 [Xenorhabdus bovienii str. Jollieti]